MLPPKKLTKFTELSQTADSVLLTYNVYGRDQYNETMIENGKLIGIRPNKEIGLNQLIQTYTGIGVINLASLEPRLGESKFFDSVADYKKKNIQMLNIEDAVYWDFGTLKRYYNSLFDVLAKWNTDDLFILFLKKYKSLDKHLIHNLS